MAEYPDVAAAAKEAATKLQASGVPTLTLSEHEEALTVPWWIVGFRVIEFRVYFSNLGYPPVGETSGRALCLGPDGQLAESGRMSYLGAYNKFLDVPSGELHNSSPGQWSVRNSTPEGAVHWAADALALKEFEEDAPWGGKCFRYDSFSPDSDPLVQDGSAEQSLIQALVSAPDRLRQADEEKRREQALAQERARSSATKKKSGGCYVATAVYGSYDCPQVRVLRRWRDSALLPTRWGRGLVGMYYAISPHLVKHLGGRTWLLALTKKPLDRFVAWLLNSGTSDAPYRDI